jgi:parallel beta-helix repeat protein
MRVALACFAVLALCLPTRAAAPSLQQQLAAARPGDVVTLPAGTLAGAFTVPAGVTLRGAGYRQTILDAGSAEVGVTMAGDRAGVTDLTVRGATRANVLVQGAARCLVQRVRATGSIMGINVRDSRQCRVENVIVADNRYGIVVNGGAENAVVNCTLARNASVGLSLAGGDRHAAFNNLIADTATGVVVGEAARRVTLDYNLYYALYLGKLGTQLNRVSLGDWQYLTGFDAHALQSPVTFADGDYVPVNAVPWALDRTVVTDWGAARLAGITAPATDIDGRPRRGRPDIGACETARTPERPATGTVAISRDAGLKSAGVFTPDGRLVAYLFHNLPLPKGRFPFWLPTRDFQGRAIPAGTYQVRVVEQALRWEFLGGVGDNGALKPAGATAPWMPRFVAFDTHGHLLVGQGWSEDHTNLRAYDVNTGQVRWHLSGQADIDGMVMSDGHLCLLRVADKAAGTDALVRVDTQTGTMRFWGEKQPQLFVKAQGRMAALNTQLAIADAANDAILVASADNPVFTKLCTVAKPTDIAADPVRGVYWVISDQRDVLQLSPSGVVRARVQPVGQPIALAVAPNGQLAIASRERGQVCFFDAADPQHLVLRRTLGTGNDPIGSLSPECFLFKGDKPYRNACHLAFGPGGDLAVVDNDFRVTLFDAAGRVRWHTFGIFGGTVPSYADPNRLVTDGFGISVRLDPARKTWTEEALWDVRTGPGAWFEGEFRMGQDTCRVYTYGNEQKIVILRQQGYTFLPVSSLQLDRAAGTYLIRKDTNHDGRLDAADGGEVALDTDGKPYGGAFFSYLNHCAADGTFQSSCTPGTWQVRFPWSIDADGVPVYRPAHRVSTPVPPGGIVNPYSWKAIGAGGIVRSRALPNGGFVANINLPDSGANSGVMNSIGNSLIEVAKDGTLRWMHPLPEYGALAGGQSTGTLHTVGVGMHPEMLFFNNDGLGLGSLGIPAAVNWEGMWLDYTGAIQLFRGGDRRTYAVMADNIKGYAQWFRLANTRSLRARRQPLTLAPEAARTLAALPGAPEKLTLSRPPAPVLRIPRLAAPLPIDGDLAKWRAAGITPQLLLTPESSAGGVTGPRDCSAVMRLAYHGDRLYVQILRFDDVVTMHHPLNKSYTHDTIEMAINSYASGFKFNITHTLDQGAVIHRQRWWPQNLEWLVPADLAPRRITVLPDARAVDERRLIEGIYGEDMAACAVIVTEFALPINAKTYHGDPAAAFPMQPGTRFWLGFMIDDNDDPGSDQATYTLWPATYGTFNAKEDGAIAVLE